MKYELPSDFLGGRTAIRVGYSVDEFVKFFNEYVSPDRPSWEKHTDFRFMTDQYGEDVALCYERCTDFKYLSWCSGVWFTEQGYNVINLEDLEVISEPQSIESILDLL